MQDSSQFPVVMAGARAAISRGLSHIEQQVNSIEGAVYQNPALVFDLARTLVESACRTILTERGVSHATDADLSSLFRLVTQTLPMLPPEESQEASVRRSIAQTLSGLNATIQGITELRNQLGFASHGSDRPRPSMEAAHAMLSAQAADTIVGFLYQIHTQDRPLAPSTETSPERDVEFDQHIDGQYETVRIFEIDFLASEILFQMEPNSYRIFLAEFLGEDQDT